MGKKEEKKNKLRLIAEQEKPKKPRRTSLRRPPVVRLKHHSQSPTNFCKKLPKQRKFQHSRDIKRERPQVCQTSQQQLFRACRGKETTPVRAFKCQTCQRALERGGD